MNDSTPSECDNCIKGLECFKCGRTCLPVGSTSSEGWEIEKKLNEVLVNYNWSPVSDYSGSMFKEMEKLISDLLSSQLKEVLGVIESKKVSEMSASEYNEVVLTKDTPQHKNLRHRLTGSHNHSWITAEIYNLALDDIKAELEREDR